MAFAEKQDDSLAPTVVRRRRVLDDGGDSRSEYVIGDGGRIRDLIDGTALFQRLDEFHGWYLPFNDVGF
jgi:hypothetical protein